ncbi:Transcription factor bHLH36 [Musa troglodytarum]|uniref:Transcription factor bHLH36 n=2 Tax=Musa troglodytarum TaxID=320322 RepID=A0A9E7I1D7_9LILI|nr:Transcription factor bHLH36 [Musa troglodytarum]
MAALERLFVFSRCFFFFFGLCSIASSDVFSEDGFSDVMMLSQDACIYCPDSDLLTQQNQLDQAASYVKELRERIDTMKQRKDSRTGIKETIKDSSSGLAMEFRLPVIQVRHQDSKSEVVLISGIDKRFAFHEVICVLEEEGAQVLNASFSTVGEKIFHTIHSQASGNEADQKLYFHHCLLLV